MIGAGLALGAGLTYGVCLVPFQKWYDVNVKHDTDSANALVSILFFDHYFTLIL